MGHTTRKCSIMHFINQNPAKEQLGLSVVLIRSAGFIIWACDQYPDLSHLLRDGPCKKCRYRRPGSEDAGRNDQGVTAITSLYDHCHSLIHSLFVIWFDHSILRMIRKTEENDVLRKFLGNGPDLVNYLDAYAFLDICNTL